MKYGEWVIKYRWLAVAVSLLALGLSGYGLKFLAFEADNRVFFSADNPQLKALERLEDTYNKEDSVIFVVAAPGEDGSVFTAKTLGAIRKLTKASWQIPYSSRVNSITNYQHTWVDGDDMIVEDLVKDPASMTDTDLEYTRAIATGEPMLQGRLISGSGDVTAVFVTLLLPDDGEVVPQIARVARGMAEDFREANPTLDLYLSGGVMYDDAFASAGQNDMATLIPVMLAVMILIIFFSLKSISGTVATVIVIITAAIVAMGLTGWYGIRISVPVSMAPVIVITLAIADSIHVLTTVFREMRSGANKYEAITESLRVNLGPVFLTSLTTAVGFLSMNFSDAPPFNDLGNVVATGVGAAFFFSIFLLPALIAILPVRRGRELKGASDTDFMVRVGEFVIRRRNPLFAGTSIVLVILSFGYSRLEFDDDFLKYFDESFEIRRAGDFIEERLTGLNSIEYSLPSGVEFGINDPGYLARVDEFAAWWRAKPEVTNVSTITDVIKRLNRNMHGDDPSYYRVPGERELAAQYLLLYEMSLPYGLDLNNQLDVSKSATRMIVTLKAVTSKRMRELEAEGNGWLKTNAPENFSYATGVSLMFAHISERNINGMLWGTTIALIIISGVLIIALKNIKIGLISLVPNLIPAYMTFGLWGLIEGRVGLAVSVISAISLGIVVDDTVHLLSKYLRARREGKNAEDSVRYAFDTVGRAILSTSIILIAGFLVLTRSGFRVNSSMGFLTAIAITFAFIADVFFLPPLLIAIDQDKKGEDR